MTGCRHDNHASLGVRFGTGRGPEHVCRSCGAIRWYRVDWGFSPWIAPAAIADEGLPAYIQCDRDTSDRTTLDAAGVAAEQERQRQGIAARRGA